MFLLFEINNMIIFFFFSLLLSNLMFIISLWFIKRQSNFEKISAYECGFQPFLENQTNFDIHFYIIALLFLIFDLEIIFLFPWILMLKYLNFLGFFSMLFFLFLLFLGFIFEWKKGALNWT